MELDTIQFGRYRNSATSTAPIEWYVLNQNDGEALLLSRYILDVYAYHFVFEQITWDKCDVRTWLNDDFYNTAFSPDEKARIQTTLIETENNYFVKDNVFLLSDDEFYKYLPPDTTKIKQRQAKATEYALENGLNQYKDSGSCWLLRNPGDGSFKCRDVNMPTLFKSKFAAFVSAVGGVCHQGVPVDEPRGIRPAIRIIYRDV